MNNILNSIYGIDTSINNSLFYFSNFFILLFCSLLLTIIILSFFGILDLSIDTDIELNIEDSLSFKNKELTSPFILKLFILSMNISILSIIFNKYLININNIFYIIIYEILIFGISYYLMKKIDKIFVKFFNESTYISNKNDFINLEGEVTSKNTSIENSVEIKIKDIYGQIHYIYGKTKKPQFLNKGDKVIIKEKLDKDYLIEVIK